MNIEDKPHSAPLDASDRSTTVASGHGASQDLARRPRRVERIQIGAVTGLATFAGLWISGRIGDVVALGHLASTVLAAGLAGIAVVVLHGLLQRILGRSPWRWA